MPKIAQKDTPKTETKSVKAKRIISPKSFSRKQLLIFAAAFAIIGGYIIIRTFAAGPVIATVQAEKMTLPSGASVVQDNNASGGQAVKLTRAGTLTSSVSLPAAGTSLSVVAHGNKCYGSWPKFSVVVDSTAVFSNVSSASNSWKSYSSNTKLTTGSHSIKITSSNTGKVNRYCTHNLYLDITTFYGETVVTPAPTVSFSASPTSVTAGSSSTLTWNSTNASSCSATGSWSGTQATSGSVSTGALNSAATYNLTCSNTTGSATAATTVNVTAAPAPTPIPPTSSGSFYGTQLASDSLGNLEVGKYNGRVVSYRFKATHTGQINNIGIFLIFRAAGYYAGNGGNVHMDLQTDDGSSSHVPSGTVLGSHTITDPMTNPFRNISLDSPVSLTSGQLYHIVFTNTSSSPTTNWVSVDDQYQYTPLAQMQPTISDTDLAVVWKQDASSSWTVNRNHTPIYIVRYQDGTTQGTGYIDALSESGLHAIGGTNVVEQTMTISGGNKTVSKIAVRLAKTGSSDLKMEIKQGSTVVSSVTVPASSISSSNGWVVGSLPSAVTLSNGTSYALVLSSGTASYNIFPLQEGTAYGITGGNNFTDGQYMYSNNGGSNFQTLNSRSDYDLQFYLQ